MLRASALLLAAVVLFSADHAFAVDWSKVPEKKVMVFYPARVSYERLTMAKHSGRSRYEMGAKSCFGCHGNIDEHPLGDELVHDQEFENLPIPKKPGGVDMMVKIAHDATNLYVRLQFNPGDQPDAAMDKTYETKVAMMLDDGGVPEMARGGCWIVCHDNLTRMPSGEGEVTKYLGVSRISMDRNGGADIKPQADLDQLRADGNYLEYWQARLNKGAKAVTVDGTILEKRAENPKPAVSADATRAADGTWTVTFRRKLIAGAPYKDIVPGKTYTLGFSMHAGHTEQRFHYVSFERSMVLDQGDADFVATLQK
jgi:cytochrome c-type protein NapC